MLFVSCVRTLVFNQTATAPAVGMIKLYKYVIPVVRMVRP